MEGILSIKNLSKSFERSGMKTDALKNASFELKCGEILGIVGTIWPDAPAGEQLACG